MTNADTTLPMATPPISSSSGSRPQETLLQRGMFDPPVTPGTLGHLDRFEILRLLGEGGMGQVYLAREPRTDTRVAVKILRPQMADDPQSAHRFLTEARHMYRLSHPRILRVLEVSDRKEGPYYVMPYVEGGSLLGQYSPDKPMPTERILSIANQVAEALTHAHAHGLIHRDLKPGNVLLDKDGNAYLTDFGLVRTVFNDSMVDASSSHLEGTAPYMSPAVARGEAEDTRCDIYAFGALLYELLAGQPPYAGRTPQIILDQVLKGPPTAIRTVNPKASPALVRIAEGCLARELRDRYASMTDVVSDLALAAKGVMPLGPHQQEQRRRLPRFAVLLAGALAVAGVAGVAVHHSLRLVQDRSHLVQLGGAGSPSTLPATGAVTNTHPSEALAQANSSSATDPSHFTYTTNNNAITITKYTGPGGDVSIPSTINGLPVTGIGDYAFYASASLTGVSIPASVTSLSGSSFISAWPEGHRLLRIVVDAANPAYYSTSDGVVFNKDKSCIVSYPSAKAGDYVIPKGVASIGDRAFYGSASLTSVTIPNSVTNIGSHAFVGCAGLTDVTIPASVTSVGISPFRAAYQMVGRLLSITVDPANPAYCSSTDGVLFTKDKTCLINYPYGRAGAYVIPNSVTNIGLMAFQGSRGLTRLAIPASVTSIPDNPLIGSWLTSIIVDEANPAYSSSADGVLFDKQKTYLVSYPGGRKGSYVIPDGVTHIGFHAFHYCTNLTSLTIPSSVTSIGLCAFLTCSGLTSVYFKGDAPSGTSDSSMFASADKATIYHPADAKGWGKEFGGRPTAVWNQDEIPYTYTTTNGAITITKYTGPGGDVTIPSTINGLPVTGIGSDAFMECINVTNVTIPASVTSLEANPFDSDSWRNFRSRLLSITVDAANYVYSSSADGVLFNKEKTSLICYPGGKTGGYVIPEGVTSIGEFAFGGCGALTSVTISGSVTNIGHWAFIDCTSLTRMAIPASVTSIGLNPFNRCGKLLSITVDAASPACSSSADGVLFNKEKTSLICYPGGKTGEYVIPEGVTSIGEAAFGGCGTLTSVTIPDSVTNIGGAFFGCNSLTNATIPNSVTSLEGQVFRSTRLTRVTIPDKVTSIGYAMFCDCCCLTNVTIPNSVTSIGDAAFYGCSALPNMTIPDGVSSIGHNAFGCCPTMTGVYFKGNAPIGDSDLSIFAGANNVTVYYLPGTTGWGKTFAGRPTAVWDGAMQSPFAYTTNNGAITITQYTGPGGAVTIPSSINGLPATGIGQDAFKGCTNVTSVTFPNSVTGIGKDAFAGCSGLTNITIPSSITSITGNPFPSCSSLLSIFVDASNPAYSSNADGVMFDKKMDCLLICPGGKAGSYEIPNPVTRVGVCAFNSCTKLTNVTIPDGVTKIEGCAFWCCAALTNVMIGNSVSTIEGGAFGYCHSLTSVTLPASVISIAGDSFYDCRGMSSFVVDPGNPSYSSSEDGVLFNKEKTSLVCYPGGKAGSYAIPNSVKSIMRGAFGGGPNLTSVTIPASVTSIGAQAFAGCARLTNITLPNSITSIEFQTFWGCAGLTNVTLPKSVTSIEGGAFAACNGLVSIEVDAANPAFSSKDGIVFDKENSTLVCYPRGRTGSFDIPSSVKNIGNSAFGACPNLTSVTIPASVTNIGYWAFGQCPNLASIYFNGSAPRLDKEVFLDCKKATVFCLPGTKGWGPTFGGRPTKEWKP